MDPADSLIGPYKRKQINRAVRASRRVKLVKKLLTKLDKEKEEKK